MSSDNLVSEVAYVDITTDVYEVLLQEDIMMMLQKPHLHVSENGFMLATRRS